MHHQGEIPQQDHKFTSNLIPPRKWARIFNNPWNFLAFLGGKALLRTWIQGWRQEILFISWFNEALLLTSPFSMLPAPRTPGPFFAASRCRPCVPGAWEAVGKSRCLYPKNHPSFPGESWRESKRNTHTHICWGFSFMGYRPVFAKLKVFGDMFFCLLPKQRKTQPLRLLGLPSQPPNLIATQNLWGFKEPCLSSSIRKRWISPFCWWMTRLAAKEMPVTNWAAKKTTPTFLYTGWLIGILLRVYYNPYITE